MNQFRELSSLVTQTLSLRHVSSVGFLELLDSGE